MQDPTDLFTAAHGMRPSWRVEDVRFEFDKGEIHFDVVCGEKQLTCPVCGQVDQPIHDRKAPTWQHIHFFQYRAYIHAQLPRVACGRTAQVEVPWARDRAGFTLLFEALALSLTQHLPVREVARLLGVTDHRLWASLNRLVGEARAKESHHGVRPVGVDETHIGRLGYISLFHDAEARRTLFASPGLDQAVFERFCADLTAHGGAPHAIQAIAVDLSKAFQAASRKHQPEAAPCFDAFQLVKLANEALEEVQTEDELRGIRWATLKDARRWTMGQLTDMHWLQRCGLKTARAWRMKGRLCEILYEARMGSDPRRAVRRWVGWARRSRLTPFKRLGATIRGHMKGIFNSYRYKLSNGTAESLNTSVQAAIVRARGFRMFERLTAMIYLVTGKLTHLPKPPYRATRSATV